MAALVFISLRQRPWSAPSIILAANLSAVAQKDHQHETLAPNGICCPVSRRTRVNDCVALLQIHVWGAHTARASTGASASIRAAAEHDRPATPTSRCEARPAREQHVHGDSGHVGVRTEPHPGARCVPPNEALTERQRLGSAAGLMPPPAWWELLPRLEFSYSRHSAPPYRLA